MSKSPRDASRRSILAGLATGSAGLLAAGGAQAITARPRSDYGAVLDAACGATADHKRQIAEVESVLGAALPDLRVMEVLRRTQCPSCGCPLAPPAGGMSAF